MIIQNNPTPWILLILLAAVGCGILAMTLGADPFGPGPEVRAQATQTFLAINAPATQAALGATLTPMALSVGQTAVAGELTAMPPAHTATALSAAGTHAAILYGGTQTQMADQALMNRRAIQATATAMVRTDNANQLKSFGGFGLIVLVTLALCAAILGHTAAGLLQANARQKLAQAQTAAARRDERTVNEFFAAHRKPAVRPARPQVNAPSYSPDRRGQDMADAEWVERVLAPIMKKENLDHGPRDPL